jgi:hypothetical protein
MKIDWKETAIGFAIFICFFLAVTSAFGVLWTFYTSATSPPRNYMVIDHSGREWHGLRHIDGGLGWSLYKDDQGRRYKFRGNYSAIEEATKN